MHRPFGGTCQRSPDHQEMTDMAHVDFSNIDNLTNQLSQLLGLEISRIQFEDHVEGVPATVHIVSLFDRFQTKHRLVIKNQEDRTALCLYAHYLRLFGLNSPHYYGYIDVDGRLFLVMEYVHHSPPNWSDPHGYFQAVDWLIKKDRITSPHVTSLRHLDCFGEMRYYGVPYWLSQFERWDRAASSPAYAQHLWRIVHANQSRIDTYIQELISSEIQTVVHGDIHLSNVLFGAQERENEVFVIDWTQPHIGSVTKDLASLYDNAPNAIKDALLARYQQQIHVPRFDELFAKAKLLRDIGYISWMAEMICDYGPEAMDHDEIDRVMHSVVSTLG
jgi:hypothetical protein